MTISSVATQLAAPSCISILASHKRMHFNLRILAHPQRNGVAEMDLDLSTTPGLSAAVSSIVAVTRKTPPTSCQRPNGILITWECCKDFDESWSHRIGEADYYSTSLFDA